MPVRVRLWIFAQLALSAFLASAIVFLPACKRRSVEQSEGRGKQSRVAERAREQSASVIPIVAPVQYLPLSREQAIQINSATDLLVDAGPAAHPFGVRFTTEDAARALQCLTQAVYYEAASEGVSGQRAVAQVVLNRVRNPAFPASVCGVVFQGAERRTGCQFTFTCDGSLLRTPSRSGWRAASQVAVSALAGDVFAPVGHATHYHTYWVHPYWAPSLKRVNKIGTHIFYRWPGFWGTPGAFRQRYKGAEYDPSVNLKLRLASNAIVPDTISPNLLNSSDLIDETLTASDVDAAGKVQAKPAVLANLKADGERGTLIGPATTSKPKADTEAGVLLVERSVVRSR